MVEILILVALVAFIVVATARFKFSPFLVLLLAALIGAIAYRIPLADVVGTATESFGKVIGSIGIVIVLGTIIGVILERSGAAISMAQAIIRVLGKRFPTLTMSVIGYIVSIPVFCDSGYVILNSLRRSLARQLQVSPAAMAIALMTGLFATHGLVPPTPGPIAAAGNLGATDQLGQIILWGLLVAAVSAGAGLLWANRFLKRDVPLLPDEDEDRLDAEADEVATTGLPSAFASFAPILIPILLICLASVAKLPSKPFGEGVFFDIVAFLGAPAVALLLGLAAAFPLLRRATAAASGDGESRTSQFNSSVEEGIRVAAPIILITGAGAAFGGVLGASPLTGVLTDALGGLGWGVWVPFIVAAALKSAQGSSTVALVTTSAMMAPLLGSLGLDSPMGLVLTVLAIGAGGMVVSHANDSFFWVVSRMSRFSVATAYRIQTTATLIQGVAAMLTVWVLSLILL